ncbi:MAG: trypsin-like peptidase domain-containing protein [Bacteroidota bacterium]
MPRVVGLALGMVLCAIPSAHAQEALAFASVDREAVAVGGTVTWTLEALAVAPTENEHRAWVRAMSKVAPDLGAGWQMMGASSVRVRKTGDIIEVRRQVVLRAREPGVQTLPSVDLQPDVSTPALSVHAHAASSSAMESVRSVVAVETEGRVDGRAFRRAGSAFLIGDDALVTAYHVVAGARKVRVVLPNGRRIVAGRAWALDPVRDVAILQIDAERAREGGLRPLALAPEYSSGGGVTFSGGWPNNPAERVQTITVGSRHADLDLGDRWVRVSANPVRPGDSGGPLLDEQGRVLGVIVSGRSTENDPDLLRQDVCLAADPFPAIRAFQQASEPVGLRRALRNAAAEAPSARALEAVDAVRLGRAPGGHVARVAEAARLDPDDPVLQFLAGSILEEAGNEDQARGAYEGASRAGYFPAVYALAHHHLRHGELVMADSLFSRIRHSSPYAQLGAMGAARAFMEQGRHLDAQTALEEVLAHDSRFAPALYLLGLVHLANDNEPLARALMVRLARRPEWARALRLPIDSPVLRPVALKPLPAVAETW